MSLWKSSVPIPIDFNILIPNLEQTLNTYIFINASLSYPVTILSEMRWNFKENVVADSVIQVYVSKLVRIKTLFDEEYWSWVQDAVYRWFLMIVSYFMREYMVQSVYGVW